MKINTPSELREVLGETIVALLEDKINIKSSEAVVGLSNEIHKSIAQEWEMRVYMAEQLTYKQSTAVEGIITGTETFKLEDLDKDAVRDAQEAQAESNG